MSLPGRKAPAGVSGVRRWLVTIVVSVLALVLTLVVISLSVGSSLPRTSLQDYLPVIVSGLGKLSSTDGAGGNRNSTAVGEELVQGGRESLVEQNGLGGDVNSGQPSPVTEKIESKEPDPVAPGDTTSTPDEDSSKDSPKAEQGTCDLYHGRWVLDSSGPLYTNNSCPIITQMQNCQGNGRPDKEYENWRWKPEQCILPRFDARKFLELMRGKTLAFVGDSVARNQMESLVCLLWQVDVPQNRGNKRMHKWLFKSTSTTIARVWSSWLVHRSTEAVGIAPKGIDKVFLDIPDETFMDFLPRFDVIVLSSGHWFAKQSAYVLNGNVVGGQLWWPRQAGKMQMNNVDAFGVSVETSLTSVVTDPNFTGLAIVRTWSPDHYEGGAWNTGGSCTGKVKPLDEVVRNGFTDAMYGLMGILAHIEVQTQTRKHREGQMASLHLRIACIGACQGQ
ncbi:protein YLS7-like [Panicum miliaceum]|uniref:Protein YLS7-like n=1 Tax=Panicum miliaceum TaxID=4540 RepID=A0A3L6SIP3_PANMI|nr:protein YLS7-like [Panicum miliaceum]